MPETLGDVLNHHILCLACRWAKAQGGFSPREACLRKHWLLRKWSVLLGNWQSHSIEYRAQALLGDVRNDTEGLKRHPPSMYLAYEGTKPWIHSLVTPNSHLMDMTTGSVNLGSQSVLEAIPRTTAIAVYGECVNIKPVSKQWLIYSVSSWLLFLLTSQCSYHDSLICFWVSCYGRGLRSTIETKSGGITWLTLKTATPSACCQVSTPWFQVSLWNHKLKIKSSPVNYLWSWYFMLNSMYVCVTRYEHVHMPVRAPRTGVTDSHESSEIGAGNWTQFPWKSSISS